MLITLDRFLEDSKVASKDSNRKNPYQLDTFSELSQTSKMEHFAKLVNGIQPLTIFTKRSILDVSQGYDYTSDNTKQKPGAMKFISHKNNDSNLCRFLPLLTPILSSNYYFVMRRF